MGYDPITKREIPRSYVYFLEARVAYLEKLLVDNGIGFKEAVAFDEDEAVKVEAASDGDAQSQAHQADASEVDVTTADSGKMLRVKREKDGFTERPRSDTGSSGQNADQHEKDDNQRIHNLVSNIGMVSVQGTSDPRYLGSTSGISFARIVFAAVKSTVSGNSTERGPIRPNERLPSSATGMAGGNMRDSFFGLQKRPMMKCASFPDRELADKLVDLYFEHANPQVPILHRGEFVELLDSTYAMDEKDRSPRSLYTLNIVFAIGAGIILEEKNPALEDDKHDDDISVSTGASKRARLSSHQYQPEEYHASAIVHLESFLSSSSGDSFGGLEELQAVLLLASFALLRPVAPGLWYIVGVAMRLAVDLGLHYEDGTGIDYVGDVSLDHATAVSEEEKGKLRIDSRERGRREWVRDLRRRLWWCAYSLDRLVATCVGRPFGIADQAVTTDFPSLLDDKYITKAGFIAAPAGSPSYKYVAHHYFKLRLLQSEIQDVLLSQQARFARKRAGNTASVYMNSDLSSPFLQDFDSFRSWRKDIHRRLDEWKHSSPSRHDIGVRLPVDFLELNYWQTLIMLYRQCLTVPPELASELTPAEDVSSPFSNMEDADDEDEIYINVAEAGQKVLRIYRQMHHLRLVNYTYLATHHLFMAGISFLYAIWHSPAVRSRLTLDDVDFTVLAAMSLLGDLMHKCPPAEACRDAFERMSKATVQMCLSTTGFGNPVESSRAITSAPRQMNPPYAGGSRSHDRQPEQRQQPGRASTRRTTQSRQPRPLPKFDMNLGDLFNDSNSPPNEKRPNSAGAQPLQPSSYVRPEYGNTERSTLVVPLDQTSRTYPQRAQSVEYYSNPASPQAQQSYYYGNSPQSASPASIAASGYINGQAQFQTTDQQLQQESHDSMALDFANFDSRPVGPDGNPDYENFMSNFPQLGAGAGQETGIDLGFGLSVDFQHDWSEGANYDLLEGFFFGGSGGGGPGYGPGDA